MRLINHCDEDQYTLEDNNGTMIQADGTPYDLTNSNVPSTVTPTTFSHPQTTILANYEFLGHGTDGWTAATSDLVLRMVRVTRGACIEINNVLGVNNPSGEPPLDRATGAKLPFDGADPCSLNSFILNKKAAQKNGAALILSRCKG